MTSYLNTGNMEYKMYYKDWKLGGTKSSKASILLDMIETIHKKTKHIEEGRIILFNNNKLLIRTIWSDMLKENLFITEASTEITRTHKIIKKSIIEINL